MTALMGVCHKMAQFYPILTIFVTTGLPRE